MSSTLIPKEKLSAYQRWELASFGDEPAAPEPAAPPPAPVPQFDPEEIARQNAEYINQLCEQARQQGYAEGFAQGHREGFDAGGMEAARQADALAAIAESFGRDVRQADEIVAHDLLALALDLAKAMLKTALPVKPALVLPVVSEAIRYLPSMQQPALLYLHPEDVAIVNGHMGDELTKAGWRVAEDSHLERGGCRVETPSNQIDATTASRWQRIAAALGHTQGWLE